MRRRNATPEHSGPLPPDLAAGPRPELWARPDDECPHWLIPHRLEEWRRSTAHRAWLKAGTAWSQDNGYGWGEWKALLPDDVRRWQSARGRAQWPTWPDGEPA